MLVANVVALEYPMQLPQTLYFCRNADFVLVPLGSLSVRKVLDFDRLTVKVRNGRNELTRKPQESPTILDNPSPHWLEFNVVVCTSQYFTRIAKDSQAPEDVTVQGIRWVS